MGASGTTAPQSPAHAIHCSPARPDLPPVTTNLPPPQKRVGSGHGVVRPEGRDRNTLLRDSSAACDSLCELERLQVFLQIALLLSRELKLEHRDIVLDDILQGLRAAVMEIRRMLPECA